VFAGLEETRRTGWELAVQPRPGRAITRRMGGTLQVMGAWLKRWHVPYLGRP
jgi:hypothetical protein